ncbi:plasmid partition protein ParG [Yersinia pseudotuberculosis]|uniref:Plasmid partition protein ParG n=1 Tax=Yersinia pseudotuberculosis TaxID=633 RepID=B7UF62_YERPU|nr:plasmid partition protein ParG [Yersinia pseudotuberculosis]MBO1552589.1 DNA partition complex ParG [Yersinia pseudotuberculosis]MBO1564111.1 DNA partition complex ParG [Yersinia pseudotuberculosis]MBO1572776.1 DNA partition complex ParG [Yersinia pseudotuberculosis]MBO1587641.1 DNA partition complex ParG [Yersinia pseudotuberculosis]MBO1632866.1 DNA partition complex ParG [Yersinia pseudotuberculosis]
MALTKQTEPKLKAAMSFGEHRQLDQVLNKPVKEKRIQVILDESKHTEFKMACLKNGTNITAVITELLDEWLAQNK